MSSYATDQIGRIVKITGLQSHDTVLMGRITYEFGYQYGLKPGQPAYLHMKHDIFSKFLPFDSSADDQMAVIG